MLIKSLSANTWFLLIFFVISVKTTAGQQNKPQPVVQKDVALNVKIDAVVKKLTLEEKVSMLHASSIFGTAGVKRLGIPGLMTDDGPLGVREDIREGWAS